MMISFTDQMASWRIADQMTSWMTSHNENVKDNNENIYRIYSSMGSYGIELLNEVFDPFNFKLRPNITLNESITIDQININSDDILDNVNVDDVEISIDI